MASTTPASAPAQPPFLTIRAAALKYQQAGFTEASLRWLAFNREHNGFGPAFVKIGRKLLLDEAAFVACGRVRFFVCEAVWLERLFQRASVNRSS